MKSTVQIFNDLEYWEGTYEFSFQFWGPDNNNVFISKGGVRLYDTGGLATPKLVCIKALEYIERINKKNYKDNNL